MTTWRVWYSKVGADQSPPRPWAVRTPTGAFYLAGGVVTVAARSSFVSAGFSGLPEGPRAILECDDVVMVDPVRREG